MSWAFRSQKPRVDFCVRCNGERAFIPTKKDGRGRVQLRCVYCGDVAPSKPSKMLNQPTINAATGRGHQSKAEANFMGQVFQARELGLIENVRGLDRGDPQETFRCDVYGNKEVEALVCKVEDVYTIGTLTDRDKRELVVLARDLRRSKVHICNYRADASWHSRHPTWGPVGEKAVIDVKGRRAGEAYRIFSIKKALVLACHGIEVEERSGRGTKLA